MPQGILGVHGALARQVRPQPVVRSRIVECSNGHVVGQIWLKAFTRWHGDCPQCGEEPKAGDEPKDSNGRET
jgi:hypothetical protein